MRFMFCCIVVWFCMCALCRLDLCGDEDLWVVFVCDIMRLSSIRGFERLSVWFSNYLGRGLL